jgi:CPA2 family monovalent cation:H+ antiporter-2
MIFKTLRLSPVLGYLVAGGIIGDHGFNIITSDQVHFLAEFGVVFLLFAIGLELSFERLKVMRKYVFGLGSLQVILSAFCIGLVAFYFTGTTNSSFIIGCGLALSSTAIVLQVIQDNKRYSQQ